MEKDITYTPPRLEMLRIEIERGFAASGDYTSEVADYKWDDNYEPEDY